MNLLDILVSIAILGSTCHCLDINGQWVEDETKREGLRPILEATGMADFKINHVEKYPWKNIQCISQNGTSYIVKDRRGPLKSIYSYKMIADNETHTVANMGDLGDILIAVTELNGDYLIN